MTADKTTTALARTTSEHVDDELAPQFWTTMTCTADLVRQLTSLADRYDVPVDDDPRAAARRAQVAVLRTTAEACRHLIRSLAPPLLPAGKPSARSALELADRASSRDVQAAGRDAAAQARDERATRRDARVRTVTGDDDTGFAARFLAACDRDSAAGDRADASADRRAAQADRDRTRTSPELSLEGQARTYSLIARLEEGAMVRQAQGLLMARTRLSAGEAFEALLLAATGPLTLAGVATHVLQHGELPAVPDVASDSR